MKVTGVIRNNATQTGVESAKITLIINGIEEAVLFSDAEGRFGHSDTVEHVGEKLTCRVEKSGFETLEVSQTFEKDEMALDLSMVAQQLQVTFSFKDEKSQPLSGVRVTLELAGQAIGTAISDSGGTARMVIAVEHAEKTASYKAEMKDFDTVVADVQLTKEASQLVTLKKAALTPGNKWLKRALIAGAVIVVIVIVVITWLLIDHRKPERPFPPQSRLPDLYVSKFTLRPATPIQGRQVTVKVTTYNKGTANAGPYIVEWWAGENYPSPACTWNVEGTKARGGRVLTCNYRGYPSWYGNLTTKVVIDSRRAVREQNEANNTRKKTIRVKKNQ